MNQAEHPISTDLRSLVNAEIPTGPGRHIVKWTILCFVVLVMSAFAVVCYALYATLDRENAAADRAQEAEDRADELEEQLMCTRESSVLFDSAVGRAAALLVNQNEAIGDLVVAIANQDEARRESALVEMDQLVVEGRTVKSLVDDAVAVREESLEKCG